MNNSRVVRPPPPPSNNWLARQPAEETKQIRDPSKSKTLPVFQTPTKMRRKQRAA